MALSLLQIRDVANANAFSSRVSAALAVAAAQVYTESWFVNTIAPSQAGSRTLTIGSIPGWVTPGVSLADITGVNNIPVGCVVTGTASVGGTAFTLTLSAPLSGTIGAGETISFPAHAVRAAFANQVAHQNYNLLAAAFIALSNLTLQTEGVDDGSALNNIPDVDLQFAINSNWNLLSGV